MDDSRFFSSPQIRQAMGSGEWFDSGDVGLARDRAFARRLLLEFNTIGDPDDEHHIHLLRQVFGHVGEDTVLMPSVHVDYGYNVTIGDRCFFNFDSIFLDGAPITFGNDVWVGPRSVFATPDHPMMAEQRCMSTDPDGTGHATERSRPITVEDGVWLGSNVTVNPGVTIGAGAVVGSGAVVTRDIPANMLALGVPAKPVRPITEADRVPASGSAVSD